ncbi:dTDP-4-dehydrorhamnose 3,5-epimerase family protein [Salinispora vitiensis]|uniref:dTDP-4-dehydrorhamnose 3,5-epimerase family protein n=1 Tax=Salinispora vitiensis TaxID=999544 RepID=UPI0009B79A6B|nr:dTDP-4-dehydrorhamnose 3,5-epimerase [Salinispora vitiensis]
MTSPSGSPNPARTTSRRDVVRGIHFRRTPPGSAKYTCCVRGRALDIVVDLRVGSPTFGRWDSVIIDPQTFRSMYLPVGVGHGFVALEDDTVVSYLLSQPYSPTEELAANVGDPSLGLPLPEGYEALLSERDRAAPDLAQLRAAGLLPDYRVCREIEVGSVGPGAR